MRALVNDSRSKFFRIDLSEAHTKILMSIISKVDHIVHGAT